MEMQHRRRLTKLCKAVNSDQKMFELCARLRLLQQAGQDDKQISALLVKLDLPLKYHLFVTGNFSDLMEIDYSGGFKPKSPEYMESLKRDNERLRAEGSNVVRII